MKLDIISPSCLKVLGVILRSDMPMTVRGLVEACGFKSPNSVASQLRTLRRAGLIKAEPGHARTIRAACRVVEA